MMFQPPRLGPGAIYLRPFDALFRSHADLIKVAEIEPQSLWTKGTAPDALPRGSTAELRHLQILPQTILTHGVGCPVGGTICDQQRQTPQFRNWTAELHAPWTSEHLSVFQVRGLHREQPCGFLMPPLQTEAGVSLAAENIKSRAAVLGKPFAFETGVNYFAPRACEMPDGQFFAAIADAADCGILLDLTNLWANQKNGRAKIHEVIAHLPLERVWEVHLAGLEFAHGHWLDAHAKGIDDDILEVASDVVPSLPNLGAIIFEIAPDRVPAFGAKGFLLELEKLHRLWSTVKTRSRCNKCTTRSRTVEREARKMEQPTPEQWEHLIASEMLSSQDAPPSSPAESFDLRPSDQRSFSLYRELAASFRRGAVAELMENTTRLLLLGMGEARLRRLMDRYVAASSPVAFPTDEALRFRQFLAANPQDVPGVEDLSRFEAALVTAAADGKALQVELSRDIDAMLDEIAAGRLPGLSTECPETVLEIQVGPEPSIRVLQ